MFCVVRPPQTILSTGNLPMAAELVSTTEAFERDTFRMVLTKSAVNTCLYYS